MHTNDHPCCKNREHEVFNLGSKGRRTRLLLGVCALSASALAAAFLVWGQIHWILRLALVAPVFGGILMILQARTRTCVVLAALGAWDLDCGTQRIPDRDLERRLRHRAYGLLCWAAVSALGITAIVALL